MIIMKDKLIELLAYPRFQLRDDMSFEDCPHSGLYNGEARDCGQCEYAPECKWLYCNDEFAALKSRPVEALAAALGFALGYVDKEVDSWGHNSQTCQCDACTWLRAASALFEDL